jgi:hypothetical protein
MTASTATLSRVAAGPADRRRSVRAIARTEARRMVRHPAFLLGLAASVLQVLFPGTESWAGQTQYRSSIAWTFVWVGMLVAAAAVAGRQRLHVDPDLFPATPSTAADRVLGTALGLLGPVVMTASFVAFAAVMNARAGGFTLGEEPYSEAIRPSIFEWAQPVLLVALAGVVGILLAQLPRARLTALIGSVLAGFIGGTVVWAFQAHPFRVLHPFMFPTYEDRLPGTFNPDAWAPGDPPMLPPDEFTAHWRAVMFDDAALGWHLLYVGGLVLLGVWVAARLADRSERTARVGHLLLAAAPLLLVGGLGQLVTAGNAS